MYAYATTQKKHTFYGLGIICTDGLEVIDVDTKNLLTTEEIDIFSESKFCEKDCFEGVLLERFYNGLGAETFNKLVINK